MTTFDIRSLIDLARNDERLWMTYGTIDELALECFLQVIYNVACSKLVGTSKQLKLDLLAEFADLDRILKGEGLWKAPPYSLHSDTPFASGLRRSRPQSVEHYRVLPQSYFITTTYRYARPYDGRYESDDILVICPDDEAETLVRLLKQIWGQRVRGIVRESELISWYDRCLRGKYADKLAQPLLNRLSEEFRREFRHADTMAKFMEERGYLVLGQDDLWGTETEH